MSYRPRLRSALIGACTAALLAGPGLLALPAQAESPQAPAAASRMSTRPEMQVMTFLGDYRDAVLGQHSEGKSTADVRKDFLTSGLDGSLYDWGAANQKDAIFRTNELPSGWSAVEQEQANGHAKVVLTQTFENGTTSEVCYQVNLDGLLIDGLTDPS
ncbi:hypothetical protein [Streptomyces sp. NBC_01264]|uniref:hypothetical protein n=1 Tax=Streptomyces sp. NBC_01264 TaxID=2903804 RepID=UPI00224D5C69|nr:hypothetical protein [Streptomyces sp. NBC_01264]MCX4778058.1 hypothetical protein [Streptomyces sp. NBC_01264]